jgi:hypothetical protein
LRQKWAAVPMEKSLLGIETVTAWFNWIERMTKLDKKRENGLNACRAQLCGQKCRRPDSNRHGSPHHPLKMACLPSSTTSAMFGHYREGSAFWQPSCWIDGALFCGALRDGPGIGGPATRCCLCCCLLILFLFSSIFYLIVRKLQRTGDGSRLGCQI